METYEVKYLFYVFAIVLVGFHWMDGRREHIDCRPGNAALVTVPLSIYGVFDLSLQQPYELANVIQAFHVQNDFFNLRLPRHVQNAISKH